jgi:putative FmdB family regulatory protein
MPTYQYACTSCGERLEAVQKFSDDPLTECPACGGRLRKVFSAVGVVFKGSGFYKTDSRSTSKKSTSSDTGQSEKTGSGKSESSTASTDKPAPAEKSAGTDTSKTSSSSSGQVA